MLAVAIAPHSLMAVPKDEATWSQELHTARLLQPHVLVGYWWQNTRLCPDHSDITAVYAPSCRTKPRKSNPGWSPSKVWLMRHLASFSVNPIYARHVISSCWQCSRTR